MVLGKEASGLRDTPVPNIMKCDIRNVVRQRRVVIFQGIVEHMTNEPTMLRHPR